MLEEIAAHRGLTARSRYALNDMMFDLAQELNGGARELGHEPVVIVRVDDHDAATDWYVHHGFLERLRAEGGQHR